MASRASFTDDSRMIKKSTIPKSLLLRDYLLDDMSSCSSNGFRSYPRRQCCTTVRFLVEIDLNKNSKQRPSIVETKPKQSSVLQRASAVMINAFKHFPFAGAGRSSRKANFLPRSLSRKLLKRHFWKKTDHKKEIKQLKSFGDLIKEKQTNPPPSSPSKFSTAVTTTTTAELTSSTSNSNSDSWSDSDITTTTDSFVTTGNSSDVNTSQNDVVNDSQEEKKKKITNGKRVGATAMTTTTYSSTTEKVKEKRQNDQIEQFSPVSVMDFPFDYQNDVYGEDEDEVSSVFQRRYLDSEGTKRLMHKTRRIKGFPLLEPVKLEERMTRLVLESTHACREFEQEDNQAEKQAIALIQMMKSTTSHRFFNYEDVESLLLGFFKERMLEENISDYNMLQTAREWMDGQTQELFSDWESQKNRQMYAKAIEKGVKWSDYDEEVEVKDIGLELEHEVFTSLIDDILLDFHL